MGIVVSEVQEIEQTVAQLSEPQLAEFRRWFAEFDADAWDRQIEADAAAGKLDALAEEALAEYRSGQAREL
jgi:hypothetical protein